MSADKFLQLQTDVRRNQQDLQSFLRDLNAWETNIKKKDQELKENDCTSSEKEKKLPPVRNRNVKKKRRKKKNAGHSQEEAAKTIQTNPTQDQQPGKKIRAYDYRAWDKFDVEKACAAVDDSDDADKVGNRKEVVEEDEYETDSDAECEEMEMQRRIMEANAEKEKGNNFFKKGNYEDAIACYSKGLEVDGSNALLSANRAMALLKLKRYEEAEKDCDVAISHDCTYVKAYARRGSARVELGKLEEAKKDFEQVLNIEPDNKQAKNEVKRIDKLLKEKEEQRRQAMEPTNIIQAVDKPPHLRSKKPLKRMIIQEVGYGVEEENLKEQEKLNDKSNRRDNVPIGIGDSKTMNFRAEQSECVQSTPTIQDVRPDSKQAEDKEKTKHQTGLSASPRSHGSSVCQRGNHQPRSTTKPAIPVVPSSSYQLQADWKRLKGHPDILSEYFKKIPPTSFVKLFQNSLDTAMLTQILTLLQESYIPSKLPVIETLEELSRVKRFDMNIMFMSSKEKQVVRNLFSHLAAEDVDQEACQHLAAKYGL
ncbi:RNA polymerase II-associated protein 3-like [Diadema setosum]|uniref:RNA polymerase II-associated protein 3-like n=1 Tax=Diadema setosum TaxID=31175 RepID=UPI003B3B18B7